MLTVLEQWLTDGGFTTGYTVHLGQWFDDGARAMVLKPMGGDQAGLIRRSTIELTLIGLVNESAQSTLATADAIIEQARLTAGAAVFIGAGEPVMILSAEYRPMIQLPIEVTLS